MDSPINLEYIVENKEYTSKLVLVLMTDNVKAKNQVFELLSALCVYSKDGYSTAMDTMEQYKVTKKQKYRFSGILEELRTSDSVPYKATILSFINCIIYYNNNINERIRLRNEFYGLKLHEILNQLRNIADKDSNLEVQLDVFDDLKASDEEQTPGAKGIDLNSPLDVFYSIYRQVCDTPHEIHFLTTLQHLLKIDASDKAAKVIWDTVETLVAKATVVDSLEESIKLLQYFNKKLDKTEHKCTCLCHNDADKHRLASLRRTLSGSSVHDDDVPSPVPPPPPPPPHGAVPPTPPPFPGIATPPPPPPPSSGGSLRKQQSRLPQQNIPTPKSKMRTLQWQKIPTNKVVGKDNVWTKSGQLFNNYVSKLNFEQIENLFAVNKVDHLAGQDETDSVTASDKKRKEREINLLDGKRSLNVNIFLKQFRMTNEEIVQLLLNGQSDNFGAEKLKSLQKILPTLEEEELLQSFNGDRTMLGTAEKFFLCLSKSLPNFRDRIEAMLIKEEFNTNLDYIKPSVEAVIEAARDVKNNKKLHELLYLVLLAGNFLNAGNYAGDAAGFKLSSLLKLTELRANKPRMNLLHYVVMLAEEKNKDFFNFAAEMKFLKEASQTSVESLINDIKTLDQKVQKIVDNIGSVGSDLKNQMKDFLQVAKNEIYYLKEDTKHIASLRLELADFFCEDEKTFKLEDCFKILQTFCDRFVKAKLENTQRRQNEIKMEARRQQKAAEQHKVTSADDQTAKSPEAVDGDGSIVDRLLANVRNGFKKYNEPNFSITAVQMVTLEHANTSNAEVIASPNDKQTSEFVRGGCGRRSMRSKNNNVEFECHGTELNANELSKTGSRRSYAVDTDGTLFDILMLPETEQEKLITPENSFARSSMRRRRSNNRSTNSLNTDILSRERAPSPNIEAQKEVIETKVRPKSDIFDNFDYSKIHSDRRVKSMYDQASAKENTFTILSDQNNNNSNKSEDNLSIDSSPSVRPDDVSYRTARWRNSDIQENKVLPKIDESTRTVTMEKNEAAGVIRNETQSCECKIVINDHNSVLVEKNKETLAKRFSSTALDDTEIRRVLDTATDVKNKTDEHTTAMSDCSVKSKRWRSELNKTDIDKVLKAIEETGKQIDQMVTSEPLQINVRETDADSVRNTRVTVDTKVLPQSDTNEPEQSKVKRDRRKQRSALSMDDIHAAFKNVEMLGNIEQPIENKNSLHVESDFVGDTQETLQFPVIPPRRSKQMNESVRDKSKEYNGETLENTSATEKYVMNDAAKLAEKKLLRDQRFGDNKDAPIQTDDNSQGRWKSNVEQDNVDEAFKDFFSKNNMSRSKSYDEAVARNSMSDGDLTIGIDEKQNSLKNSTTQLFTDGRRNGRIFAEDENNKNSIMLSMAASPGRLSNTGSTCGDSPKSSSSRLSIKSTNTSTETLRELGSDDETMPGQKRKELITIGISDKIPDDQTPTSPFSNRISDMKEQLSTRRQTEIVIANATSEKPRNNSDVKVTSFDENDESVQERLQKWKKKLDEKRRHSFYDNVQGLHSVESGNLSPIFKTNNIINSTRANSSSVGSLPIIHKLQGSNELQNDIGSRCSYASSSDSTSRDEGFETMSGTVSQRTSLCSTQESELMQNFTKTQESMTKLQINENIIAAGARASVHDTKKARTESWTEAVAINAGNINIDSSLESSMEYHAKSSDCGHGPLKAETWSEQAVLESSIKSKMSSDSGSMPTASTVASVHTEKKVPSYMRGTASSSRKHDSSSTPENDGEGGHSTPKANPHSKGYNNSSLSKGGSHSNTSLVSATSVSDVSTSTPVKMRVSLGGQRERPSSIHTSMPGSRSATPISPLVRPQTPPSWSAVKSAAHASSTIASKRAASRSTPSLEMSKSTKTNSAHHSQSGELKHPTTATHIRSYTSTPNLSKTRSKTHASNPLDQSMTPAIEEEEEDLVNLDAPSRLKRSQSIRMKSTSSRSLVQVTNFIATADADNSPTPKISFMSPTAASKAKVDKVKLEKESPPPTPPPRRSKDTDALPNKVDPSSSPLKRHSSLRISNKGRKELDKTSEHKIKDFFFKRGANGSKVRPEPNDSGKLASVDETVEKDSSACENEVNKVVKSPSFKDRILGKTKGKSAKKSTDSLKSDANDKKKKPGK